MSSAQELEVEKQEKQEELTEEEGARRSLRPRKINNYRTLIEGDQTIQKFFNEEDQKYGMSDSNQDEDDFEGGFGSKRKRGKKGGASH